MNQAINIAIALIMQLPDAVRELARRFLRAYQAGDLDHPDELVELGVRLERSPEGRAFVEAFCKRASEV